MQEITEKRMLQEPEMKTYIGLGRTKARELCESIGATVRVGRRVLYDKTVIDAYFDSATKNNQ